MHELIVTLIVAGISGITFIAYKHPNGYSKISPWLFGVVNIIFVGTFIWGVGVMDGYFAVSDFLETDARDEAWQTVKKLNISQDKYFLLTYLGVNLFLGFLKEVLPKLTHEEKTT